MRLHELLAIDELGLQLLAGESQLDREIRWIHTTDLLDPSSYLRGGELILTSGLWRESAADSPRFVSALTKSKTSGLGLGVYVAGSTPPDLIAACEGANLPLFEVPNSVPFVTVSETVIQRAIAQTGEAKEQLHQVEHALTAVLADSGGPAELLAVLAEAYPVSCWVLDRCGAILASTGCEPDEVDAHLALEAALRARKDRHASVSLRTGVADLLPIRASGRPHQPAAGYLVCNRPESEREQTHRAAVDAAVDHLVLALSQRSAVKSSESRFLRELLARITAGSLVGHDAVSSLSTFGLRHDDTCIVLMAGSNGNNGQDLGVLLEMTVQRLDVADVAADRAVLDAEDTRATLIVPLRAPASVADKVRGVLTHLAGVVPFDGVSIGMSEPPRQLHELRRMLLEAHHARLAAATLVATPAIATSDQVSSHRLLAALSPPDLVSAFRSNLLDALLAYDECHQADLVHTLRSFLAGSCAWQRTADHLHIHVNTLRYRIERIEQITERSLAKMEDRIDLYLALELQ